MGRDYLSVISDAVIDQMTMGIVGIVMPYQYELGIVDSNHFHVFHRYFSHKLIGQFRLVFRLEAQGYVPDRAFNLRIKHTLIIETVRYFTVVFQQDTVGSDDFSIVFAHYIAHSATVG